MVLPAPAYPIMGIVYLGRHIGQLGPQFLRSLAWALGVAISTITPLMAFTFKYQNRIMATTMEQVLPRLANLKILGIGISTWSTMFLAVGESSLIVAIVMGQVFQKEKTKGLFQTILQKEQKVPVGPFAQVTESGVIKVSLTKEESASITNGGSSSGSASTITSAAAKANELHKRAIEKAQHQGSQFGQRMGLFLLTLPLSFVPILGPLAFCYINGSARGQQVHRRYFDLKEMTGEERNEWVAAHKSEYRSFGVIAQGLELIPLAGIIFGFSNTIGAALWAADLERQQFELRAKKLKATQQQQQQQEEEAKAKATDTSSSSGTSTGYKR